MAPARSPGPCSTVSSGHKETTKPLQHCLVAANRRSCRATGSRANHSNSDSKKMAEQPLDPRVQKPRVEPEIILPGEPLRRSRFDQFTEAPFGQRIYVAKFGSFGFVMVALAVVAIVTLVLIVLLGALLLWIPLIGLIMAAAILSRIWSRSRRGG